MDWHESVVGGLSKRQLLQPRACVFVSRASADGTGVFVRRLQRCMEEQLLTCVYVDNDPSDDLFDEDSKRILCGCRVVVVALTPSYASLPLKSTPVISIDFILVTGTWLWRTACAS